MIDHIGFSVADYARSRAFYIDALAPLGYGNAMDGTKEQTGSYAGPGFGLPGRPEFWIGHGGPHIGAMPIAFSANTRAAMDAFYRAAIAARGRDNGAPGTRPLYHEQYYCAFVFDLDVHNIEAVCHVPEA